MAVAVAYAMDSQVNSTSATSSALMSGVIAEKNANNAGCTSTGASPSRTTTLQTRKRVRVRRKEAKSDKRLQTSTEANTNNHHSEDDLKVMEDGVRKCCDGNERRVQSGYGSIHPDDDPPTVISSLRRFSLFSRTTTTSSSSKMATATLNCMDYEVVADCGAVQLNDGMDVDGDDDGDGCSTSATDKGYEKEASSTAFITSATMKLTPTSAISAASNNTITSAATSASALVPTIDNEL